MIPLTLTALTWMSPITLSRAYRLALPYWNEEDRRCIRDVHPDGALRFASAENDEEWAVLFYLNNTVDSKRTNIVKIASNTCHANFWQECRQEVLSHAEWDIYLPSSDIGRFYSFIISDESF